MDVINLLKLKQKKYQKEYYLKNKEKLIKQNQLNYKNIMTDPEKKKYMYARMKLNRIDKNGEIKPRGRPRKYTDL